MFGESIVLAALGIMATVVGVLVWLLKKLFTQSDTTIKENNKANQKLALSIERLAESGEEQIKAYMTRREEERQWQELIVKKLDVLDKKADRNHDAIVGKQVVQEQTVQHQTVRSRD